MSTGQGAAYFPVAAPGPSWVTVIGYPEPDRGPLQVLSTRKRPEGEAA